jgi:hypothetical protein
MYLLRYKVKLFALDMRKTFYRNFVLIVGGRIPIPAIRWAAVCPFGTQSFFAHHIISVFDISREPGYKPVTEVHCFPARVIIVSYISRIKRRIR